MTLMALGGSLRPRTHRAGPEVRLPRALSEPGL